MNKEQTTKMAISLINLSKDVEHIKSIEDLGFKINPLNAKDEFESTYLKSIKLLNFYEGDIFEESPYTYNLILIEIANIIKQDND